MFRVLFTANFILYTFFCSYSQEKMKGITLVAANDTFSIDALQPILEVNANYVVVNPFAFSVSEKSTSIIYNTNRQWLGEKPFGIRDAIEKAHQSGLKVMVKPQIWIPNGWVGYIEFEDSLQSKAWQKSYSDYIMEMVAIAVEFKVAMFCIGTELDKMVMADEKYWLDLISSIKEVYTGKLTYAANWTHYQALQIWEQLDYIGIDAYFPLVEDVTPSVEKLKTAWETKKGTMQTISSTFEKSIIFTEFGYLSVDGCAYKHWELEPIRNQLAVNEYAQANAIQAIIESFEYEDWWQGCFLWKWYPTENANWGEGSLSKDYTPQGKASEVILKNAYAKF